MSSSYTPTAEFTDSTTVLADGDAANATNLNAAPKKALDRTAYLRAATDGLLVCGGNARVAASGSPSGSFKVYCPPIEAVSLLDGTTWGAYSLATETELTSAANFGGATLGNSSVSAMCTVHYLNDSARLGWAMRKAIEEHYDGTVAILASGSLSHRFAQNGLAPEFAFKIWSPFLEQLDRRVIEMWQAGQWKDFCEMLPEYASKGHGEGFMHDTAMLLGVLGWSAYDAPADLITPKFRASGTRQINAVFPVTPQEGRAIPRAVASAADGYTSIATRL